MIIYLVKSTLCFTVLFGFYKLALEHKALHHFKRYYLLVSLAFSLAIPLITFTYTTAQIPNEVWVSDFAQAWESSTETSFSTITPSEKINYLPYILWTLYGIGVLIFGSRFALNLIRLTRKIRRAETLSQSYFTLALLSQTIVPHSFLKYIFLSKKPFQNREIPPEVIAHEATHVRQKHSLDVLFIEVVQVLFWFNPLFWIAKNSIRLNHEFLADQGAIREQNNLYRYQNTLLDYASSLHQTTLESSFNYSSTKKRILMLSQTFSRKRLFISALLLIPIIAGCVLVFNHDIIAKYSSDTASIEGEWLEKKHEIYDLSIYREKDTLWLDAGVGPRRDFKIPIIEQKGRFFYETGLVKPQLRELLISEDGFLTFGSDFSYIRKNDGISSRIEGVWITPDGNTKYHFNYRGCSITDLTKNRQALYYPRLIENGVTFTVGYEWYTFVFENEKLMMHDGTVLTRIENDSVYKTKISQQNDLAHNFVKGAKKNEEYLTARSIEIEILDLENYKVDGIESTKENLAKTLSGLHTDLTKKQRDRIINIHIASNDRVPYDEMLYIQKIATDYGYHRIVTPFQEIVRAKANVPMSDYPDYEDQIGRQNQIAPAQEDNYAKDFVEGAERNGRKAIVIEIENASVQVNGYASSLETFRNDIDAITKDWEETDYTDAVPSILIKEADKAFLNALNTQFLKTHFSKANEKLDLLPERRPKLEQTKVVEEKTLKVAVKKEKITVNGRETGLTQFAQTVDAITASWTDKEIASYRTVMSIRDTSDDFMEKLNTEFKKTQLYKTNPGNGIGLPPPPPPPAPPVAPAPPQAPAPPKVIKADGNYEVIEVPAPPSKVYIIEDGKKKKKKSKKKNKDKNKGKTQVIEAPSGASYIIADTDKVVANRVYTVVRPDYDNEIDKYVISLSDGNVASVLQTDGDKVRINGDASILQTEGKLGIFDGNTSANVIRVGGDASLGLFEREDPVSHLKSMRDKGAIFFYEDKKISAKRALSLAKKNTDIHVQTRYPHEVQPKVYLSDEPIVVPLLATVSRQSTPKLFKWNENEVVDLLEDGDTVIYYNNKKISARRAEELLDDDAKALKIEVILLDKKTRLDLIEE